MRLQLGVEGGFAALPGLRRQPLILDTDALPPETASQLRTLVEEANFFSLPESLPIPASAADYREYTVTVEDGERCHTVRIPEVGAPPELLELIDRMQALQ